MPACRLRTGNPVFDPRQILRQTLPPGMRLALARLNGGEDRLALRLGFDFIVRYTRLFFEQCQLQIAQRLAGRTIPLDTLTAQFFLKRLNLQLRPLQLPSELLIFLLKNGKWLHCEVRL